MTSFLVVILIIIIPIGIAFLIYILAHYFMNRHVCVGRLSFDQFLTLYSVAPDKWDWSDDLEDIGIIYYRIGSDIWPTKTSFYLSILDTIRFIAWNDRNIKEDTTKTNQKEIETAVKAWQNDIRKYCEEHDVPIKEEKNERL